MVDRMLWGAAFVVLALTGCTASYQAANHSVTATPPALTPGVTPSLTVTCHVSADSGMPYIGNLVLAFTPGGGWGPAGAAGGGGGGTPSPAPTTAVPISPKTTATSAPLVFTFAPQGGAVATTAPTPSPTTTTPKPTTTAAQATTTAAPQQPVNIATVFNLGTAKVLPSSPFNASAKGSFNPVGASSLEVTVPHPDASAVGEYRCLAYGYTAVGTPETAVATTTVTKAPSSAAVTGNAAAELATMKVTIQALQDRWRQVDGSSAFFHSSVPSTSSPMSQTASSRYLLSRGEVTGVHLAQFICTVQGGYLAEINTRGEFDHVRRLVDGWLGATGHIDVLLGATDAAQPGVWTLMQNPSSPLLTPVPWGGGVATGHCLVMAQAQGWLLNDVDCDRPAHFLCELPL